MNAKSMLLGVLVAISVAPALAQTNTAVNVFGTVEQIGADSLSVKTDDGALETYKLAPKLTVFQNKRATLADIKPNDFVASAAIRKQDGKLHSTELRIFPEAIRGQGDGQRPMNDEKKQTMTNATVTGSVIVNGSNEITVKFKGGDSQLIVDPGIPVIRIDIVDKDMVKSGVKVRVQGVNNADGTVINRITLR